MVDLDVFGLLMKNWIHSNIESGSNYHNQLPWAESDRCRASGVRANLYVAAIVTAMALYYAAAVERLTVFHFSVFQNTGQPANTMKSPVMGCCAMGHSAQSESQARRVHKNIMLNCQYIGQFLHLSI